MKVSVERAAERLHDLRIAEVVEQDVQLKDGKIELYRTKLKVSLRYEPGKDLLWSERTAAGTEIVSVVSVPV